jgi:hypothetical protein
MTSTIPVFHRYALVAWTRKTLRFFTQNFYLKIVIFHNAVLPRVRVLGSSHISFVEGRQEDTDTSVRFTIEQVMKAQRGRRVIPLLFL